MNPLNKREELAEYAHDAWAGWLRYMFSQSKINTDGTVTIPKSLVERWMRQTNTAYKALSDAEKKFDLFEADKMLEIINKAN